MIQWDMIVRDQHENTVLAVEAKGRPRTSAEWAANWRRNLLAHAHTENLPPYLLMVFPEKFYLWKNNKEATIDRLPDFAGDAAYSLQPYFKRIGLHPSNRLHREDFEAVVRLWLFDLMEGRQQPTNDDLQNWIHQSGLHDAIANKQLHYDYEAVV